MVYHISRVFIKLSVGGLRVRFLPEESNHPTKLSHCVMAFLPAIRRNTESILGNTTNDQLFQPLGKSIPENFYFFASTTEDGLRTITQLTRGTNYILATYKSLQL